MNAPARPAGRRESENRPAPFRATLSVRAAEERASPRPLSKKVCVF